jgi:hypothetical protein
MPTKPVPIKLTDGKERALRFDWEACCRFEDEFGYSVLEVGKRLGVGTINFLDVTRAIWAGLLHEEKPMSLLEVRKLLSLDDFFHYLKAISPAISEAIPEENATGKNV